MFELLYPEEIDPTIGNRDDPQVVGVVSGCTDEP